MRIITLTKVFCIIYTENFLLSPTTFIVLTNPPQK